MSDLKLKTVKPPEQPRAITEYRVLRDGVEVAQIFKRPSTKTGFRRGYCIGQVPCDAWFLNIDGKEYGQGDWGAPRWRVRKRALEWLSRHLENQN